jgi:hypothetical protein
MKILTDKAKKRKRRLGKKVVKMAGKVKILPGVYEELKQGRMDDHERCFRTISHNR